MNHDQTPYRAPIGNDAARPLDDHRAMQPSPPATGIVRYVDDSLDPVRIFGSRLAHNPAPLNAPIRKEPIAGDHPTDSPSLSQQLREPNNLPNATDDLIYIGQSSAPNEATTIRERNERFREASLPPVPPLAEPPRNSSPLPPGESSRAEALEPIDSRRTRSTDSHEAIERPVILRPLSEVPVRLPSWSDGDPIDGATRAAQSGANEPGQYGNVSREHWSPQIETWVAPRAMHQPVYFDSVPLERYGQSDGPVLQPVESTARFFATLAIMPIKLLREDPFSQSGDVGLARPNSPTPCQRQKLAR